TVKKIQGEWRITEPIYTGADESTINSMLTTLLNANKITRFEITPEQLKEYGLSDQAIWVRLDAGEGETDSLWMGDKTPVGAYVFSAKTDSVVYTINQNVKTNFEKKLFDIRDKKLLHFQRNDVRKISVENQHGEFEFEKTTPAEWTFLNINRPADNGKMSTILSRLENNRAKSFVDEEGTELRRYGLTNPMIEVTLLLGPEQGQKKLMVSREIDGKFYAKDDTRKPIFEVDSLLVKDLNQKSTDFRSTDLVQFERSDVDSLTVIYGDTLISCAKDTSGNWIMLEPEYAPVKSQKISSFFSSLDFTTISEFVRDGSFNASRYGLDRPVLTVSLYDGDSKMREIRLGSKKDNKIYAVTDQYQSVYLIPETKLKDYKLKPADIMEEPVTADSIAAE
ncbi:MAG: DUF4340 domain-containing protein, partial [Calditrichaeota bacterium]